MRIRVLFAISAILGVSQAARPQDITFSLSGECYDKGQAGNTLTFTAKNTSQKTLQSPILQVCGPVDPGGEGITWATEVTQGANDPQLTQVQLLRTLTSLPRPDCIRAQAPGAAWPSGSTLQVSFSYAMSGAPPFSLALFNYVAYAFAESPAEKTLTQQSCSEIPRAPKLKILKRAVSFGGNPGLYDIAVANVGNAYTHGSVVIRDVVSANLEITGAWVTDPSANGAPESPKPAVSGRTVEYTVPDLEPSDGFPNDSATFHLYINIKPKPGFTGFVTNSASVCGGGDETAPCTNPRQSAVTSKFNAPTGPAPKPTVQGPSLATTGQSLEFFASLLGGQSQTPHATAAAGEPAYRWFVSDLGLAPAAAGPSFEYSFPKTGKKTVRLLAAQNGAQASTDFVVTVSAAAPGCTADARTLCLLGGRFKVQANWQAINNSTNGAAQTRVITSDTGAFWFFDAANLELIVKVIDGRALNGKFWMFYAALSNVQYEIQITDTQTGQVRQYVNLQGSLASFADTGAFGGAGGSLTADEEALAAEFETGTADGLAASTDALTACIADPGTGRLCLSDRFDVSVSCSAPGRTCTPTPVKLTSDTGYFWFFNGANIELMTKVVDGRGLNGKFWFFYGALSDVQYQIQVKDRVTGNTKTYTNPQGQLSSVADTNALPGN